MSKKTLVIIGVIAVVLISVIGIIAVKKLQDTALRPL